MTRIETAVKQGIKIRYAWPNVLVLSLHLAIVWSVSAASDPDRFGREVTGPEKKHFLQTWHQHLQSMDTLHMVFTQEKHLRVLQRPLVSQGELWLKGETLLYQLKNAAGAVELVMRVDDEAVQMYYPLLQRLEVIERQTVPLSSAPMPFMSRDLITLTQAYDSELFEAAGRYTLKLTPNVSDDNAPFATMRLQIEAFRMREMSQVEANGDRVIMTISTFEPNASISQAQLALNVPPGTRVVHPMQP